MRYEGVIQTLARPARPAFRVFTILALLVVGVFTVMSVSAQDDMAMVRVFHGSAAAGPVDVYVDGEVVAEGLEFTNATDYLELEGGEHQVQVVPAGEDPANAAIDASVPVEGGMNYTVAAIGDEANLEAMVLNDDSSEPESGNAHVRAVHAIPGGPAVTVQTADGTTLFEDLEYGNATDYAPVPAGSVDLQVVPAEGGDAIIEAMGVELEDGEIYSVFAVPTEDGTGGQPVVLTDMAATAGGGAGATPDASPEGTPGEGTPDATPGDGTPTTTGAQVTTTPTTAAGTATTPTVMMTTTPTADAAMTPTGTGGGQPGMPTTGGGGMAGGSTPWALIAAVTLLAAGVVGGSAMLATRRPRP